MHSTDPKLIVDVIKLVMSTQIREGQTRRQKHMEIAARCGADPRALLLFFRDARRVLAERGHTIDAAEMELAHNCLADDLEARFATEEWRQRPDYFGHAIPR